MFDKQYSEKTNWEQCENCHEKYHGEFIHAYMGANGICKACNNKARTGNNKRERCPPRFDLIFS